MKRIIHTLPALLIVASNSVANTIPEVPPASVGMEEFLEIAGESCQFRIEDAMGTFFNKVLGEEIYQRYPDKVEILADEFSGASRVTDFSFTYHVNNAFLNLNVRNIETAGGTYCYIHDLFEFKRSESN